MQPDWGAEPKLLSHFVQQNRQQFTFPSERYPYWFWLAAESGHFWFRIGNGGQQCEGECHPGEWLLCPPDEVLHRRVLSLVSFQGGQLQFDGVPSLTGKISPRDLPRTHSTFAQLRKAAHAPEAAHWRQHLFLDLWRTALWEKQTQIPFRPRDAHRDAHMEKAATWLEAHLPQKISLAAVANEYRLTPVAFTRRFRAATGFTPSEFVLMKRLERARTLLLDTDDSLERIAERCGFGTGFYLSRQWSKRIGGSPAKFRRENRV